MPGLSATAHRLGNFWEKGEFLHGICSNPSPEEWLRWRKLESLGSNEVAVPASVMLVLRGTVGWAVGMGDEMGHLRADGAACVQDEEHLCQEVTASDAELFALGWEGSRDKLHLSLTACSTRHLVPEAFVHDLLFLCGHHVTERPHSELWGCQSHPAPLPLAGPCPLSDPDSESRPSTAQLSQGPAGLTLFHLCPFNENIIFSQIRIKVRTP